MAPKKTTTPMTNAQLKALITQGVADALAEIEANRSPNVDSSHDSGTGIRRQTHVARECTYSDFLKCQTLNFKGIEGVVGLTQWFEKMEYVFYISNYTATCQVKSATCTLHGNDLTWWNSHVKTVGHDAAYRMPWKTLMKMLTDKYCPRGEIKKLEIKIWNLKVKGTDVASYTQRFQELALMCGRMFPEEFDQVEKYVGGIPDMIQGSVMASKPKTLQDSIEFATELMDQKIRTFAERQAENKRKLDNGNQAQRQPPKRQNVARAYSVGSSEKKEYAGMLPLCNKCKFHHNGPYTRTLTYYKCGNQGHYKSDCPELKNQNHGNQVEGTKARGMVYALRGGETNQDLDDMEDDINA
ncbi:reverse transcriptase domain-containing protein [Tanacetum coccineum]